MSVNVVDSLARDLVAAVEKEHPDDSYGACVRCFQSNTDDQHQAHPCQTLQIVRQFAADIEARTE